MILDKLSNAKMYDHLHPGLKKGLHFLLENDLTSLEVGTYPIEENKVFVMIQEYETQLPDVCRFEAHYRYADIQYVIRGQEKMEYTHIGETKVIEADKEKDLMFLEAEGETFLIKEGYFAFFTPEDAHRPGMCAVQPEPIRKAVVKVLWE
ncbi:YhcH/YjgK/YiaL family protein [Bacillus sp. EB01]|uniref:YhcH/YjgK/YiaL family protein n=1 Tax=Bacillus sp. EB01 TaxID=1347086 RepID=UPI00069457F0|nr:YhcH/YjgK/YiaL family protein [Bacillus sp. EB01]